MKTSEVLNRAADLIEERGHACGEGWPGTETFTGPLCLEGALMAALGMEGLADVGRLNSCPSYKAVSEYLRDPEINPRQVAPFMWQDRLPHGHHQNPPFDGWVGGSREAAYAHAKARVIEVLRATAVIEAARESEAVAAEAEALDALRGVTA